MSLFLGFLTLGIIFFGALSLLFWAIVKINLWFIGKAAQVWKANS